MCKISKDLKLCTCETITEETKNIWILHRYNNEKCEIVMGSTMLPGDISPEEIQDKKFILALLNQQNCFDFDYQPQEKDRLQIEMEYKTGELIYDAVFGYEFRKNKWKLKDYDPFDWFNNYDIIKEGIIKNLK